MHAAAPPPLLPRPFVCLLLVVSIEKKSEGMEAKDGKWQQ
jgi:hypothetical protein